MTKWNSLVGFARLTRVVAATGKGGKLDFSRTRGTRVGFKEKTTQAERDKPRPTIRLDERKRGTGGGGGGEKGKRSFAKIKEKGIRLKQQ